MKYEVDVTMTVDSLYDFLMYHNYFASAGFVWVALGVLSLAMAVMSSGVAAMSYRILYGFFALLFLVYIPLDLKRKAKKQLKINPYYQKPIHYLLDEEGIHSSQDGEEATVAWKNFRRVKTSKRNIILYMRNRNACILPKKLFAGKEAEVIAFLKEKVEQ